MHTDATLDIMDGVTKDLGDKFRSFKNKTCESFQTIELQREFNARVRREARSARPDVQVMSPVVEGSTISRPVSLHLLRLTFSLAYLPCLRMHVLQQGMHQPPRTVKMGLHNSEQILLAVGPRPSISIPTSITPSEITLRRSESMGQHILIQQNLYVLSF